MHTKPGHLEHGDDEADFLDLTCPGCDNDLLDDPLFLSHRVCSDCGRHFSIGARERIALLVDSGVFHELETPLDEPPPPAPDHLPPAERLAGYQHQLIIHEAVVVGYGSIGGSYAVVVALDDHLVSHTLGAMLADKVIRAFDYARREKLPLVLLAAGGTLTVPAGPLSLAQGSRLATAAAQFHLDGIALVGVLTQPMSTGVFATLASHCDVLFSEPGVTLHHHGIGLDAIRDDATSDTLVAEGWIDGVISRMQLARVIGGFIDTVTSVGIARPSQTRDRPTAPEPARSLIGQADRIGWSLVERCVASLVTQAMYLRGDRVIGDAPTATCGVGKIGDVSVAFVGLDSAASWVDPSMASIAIRKVARLARLAGRWELPLVIVIDGGQIGSSPPFSLESAYAGASLASTLALLPTPIVSVGLGSIVDTSATLILNADRQYLVEGASVVPSEELGAGWQPGRPFLPGPEVESISATECLRLGLIDGVIAVSTSGIGADTEPLTAAIKDTVTQALAELGGTGQRRLLDTRVLRQRSLGQSTPEGLAEARSELWMLMEWQRNVERNVGRSLDEWRGRWENLRTIQARRNIQRPDIGELAARIRVRRAELMERARLGDRPSSVHTSRDDAVDTREM